MLPHIEWEGLVYYNTYFNCWNGEVREPNDYENGICFNFNTKEKVQEVVEKIVSLLILGK
jgi:hypothetical protein